MIAHIYKQAFEYGHGSWNKVIVIEVTDADLETGYIQIDCPDCDGTGKFNMPDDELLKDIACGGTGKLWANLT